MSNQTSRIIKTIATLTIANGTKPSNIILAEAYAHFEDIAIYGPETLPETVGLELSPVDKAVGDYVDADFHAAESPPGTAVVVNAAAMTSTDRPTGFALRLNSGANVAAERVFTVVGRVPMRH